MAPVTTSWRGIAALQAADLLARLAVRLAVTAQELNTTSPPRGVRGHLVPSCMNWLAQVSSSASLSRHPSAWKLMYTGNRFKKPGGF